MRSTVGQGEADVAIIGAGPVGLTTALLLARGGATVEVWERWAAPYPLPRAVALAHESLRVLRSAGFDPDRLGLLEPWGTDGQRFYFQDADRNILLESTNATQSISGWPEMFAFCQPDLERALSERAERNPNITIRRGVSAVSIDDQGHQVIIEGEAHDGLNPLPGQSGFRSRVDFVVACDGANSTIRDLLNIEMDDQGFDHDWFVVDVVPIDPSVFSRDGVQHLDPARPTTLIVGGPGRFRWEFMVMPGDADRSFDDEVTAWELLAPWGIDHTNALVERQARYTFRARTAQRWNRGRVLLAGDAAHQTPPFLGQGFNSGIRDAAGVAWRLLHLLQVPTADLPALLDSYTSERRAQFETILATTVMMGNMICETDPDRAAARNARLAPRSGQIRSAKAQWPLGPGLHCGDDEIRTGEQAAGNLSHHGRICGDGDPAWFDEVFGAGFFLIGLDHDPDEVLPDDLVAAWRTIGGRSIRLDSVDGASGEPRSGHRAADPASPRWTDVDGTYRRWFDELEVTTVLIRPDFYVFGTATETDEISDLVSALLDAVLEASPRSSHETESENL